MIIRFEEFTYELTEYERDVLFPVLVRGLSAKKGKGMAIKNAQARAMLTNAGYKISDPRFRKLVHAVRCSNAVINLVASSKGYYIATEKADVEEYLVSLQERINSIQEVCNALIEQKEAVAWP